MLTTVAACKVCLAGCGQDAPGIGRHFDTWGDWTRQTRRLCSPLVRLRVPTFAGKPDTLNQATSRVL
jgi:hypothetical protein